MTWKKSFSGGFSLAEMMVVMLVLSIILAASMPIVTKRTSAATTPDPTPAGIIASYGGIKEPPGWFFCNGREVSRSAYPELFNAIGTNYGIGNGTSTFNLPNFTGRTAVGADTSGKVLATEKPDLGYANGEELHKLLLNEMPSHSHSITINPGGIHSHPATIGWAGVHSHNVWAGITNLDTGNSSREQYIQLSDRYADYTGPYMINLTDAAGNHTHPITINEAGTHTHSATIGNNGGDDAHYNMQPFLTVNYIIKR